MFISGVDNIYVYGLHHTPGIFHPSGVENENPS
jgi:hypothetical protein